MATITESTEIAGVVIVDPVSHGDERGRFVESYRRSWFPTGSEMVQGNRSDKQAGALVGLHYHLHQADYWYATKGRLHVVLHDVRTGSPTDGATVTLDIGESNDRGVFIPPGVAHGFSVLEDCTLTYLVDAYYDPADELGIAYDDPDIAVDWLVSNPVVSDRDRGNPRRAEITDALRPSWPLQR